MRLQFSATQMSRFVDLAQQQLYPAPSRTRTKVLFLEDEESEYTPIEARYTSKVYDFDWARSPAEASQFLAVNPLYDFVIVDHKMPAGHMTGSKWLFNNLDKLPASRKRVLTALKDEVYQMEALRNAGVEIASKARPEAEKIWAEVELDAGNKVTKVVEALLESSLAQKSSNEAAIFDEMFRAWLAKFPPGKDLILRGKQRFAPEQLAEEAATGTGYGAKLRKNFVDLIWQRMGLKKNE